MIYEFNFYFGFRQNEKCLFNFYLPECSEDKIIKTIIKK